MARSIAQRWRLLSGSNNWENLLNPLDTDLRQYLAHYGAIAQSTYDTFNDERLSKYTGSSRYSKRNLFSKVGLVYGNPYKYKVVKYIYATSKIDVPFMLKSLSHNPWLKSSNWIGYVAVATDEGKEALGRRDILIAWRGSARPAEWLKNLDVPLVPASEIVGGRGENAKVHRGFLSIYTSVDPESRFNKTSARDQVLSEVKKQVEKFKKETISITVTGHSLGGALSTLNAGDIVASGINKLSNVPNWSCMVTTFKYGSPKVGDVNYMQTLQSMDDLHIMDVQNFPDIVPDLPPGPYTKIGVELHVNSLGLNFLKRPGDIDTWHDLEGAYIPSVLGNHGTMKRGVARVNKTCDTLTEEYMIPPSWLVEKNRGMVQMKDGSWLLQDHETEDDEDDDDVLIDDDS